MVTNEQSGKSGEETCLPIGELQAAGEGIEHVLWEESLELLVSSDFSEESAKSIISPNFEKKRNKKEKKKKKKKERGVVHTRESQSCGPLGSCPHTQFAAEERPE